MEKIFMNASTIVAIVLGGVCLVLYFLNSCKKRKIASYVKAVVSFKETISSQEGEITSLKENNALITKASDALHKALDLVSDLGEDLGKMLTEIDGRRSLHSVLMKMRDKEEHNELTDDQQQCWDKLKPLYVSVYVLLFESDFSRIEDSATIEQLIAFETDAIDFEAYMATHPEFETKSMLILKNIIARVQVYSELERVVALVKVWGPFKVTGKQITELVDKQAVVISQKNLITNRKSLQECLQQSVWTAEKAANLEKFFLEGMEILNRGLLAEGAKDQFKKDFNYSLKRVLDAFIGRGSSDLEATKKAVVLGEVYEKVYKKEEAPVGQ